MEKVFDFNEHGVCTNPNALSFASGRFKVMIETAIVKGKWSYGFKFDTPTSGWCCGISLKWKDDDLSETESQAMSKAAQRAIEFFDDDVEWHRKAGQKRSVPQFIYDELKKLLHPQPVQLSLFDF